VNSIRCWPAWRSSASLTSAGLTYDGAGGQDGSGLQSGGGIRLRIADNRRGVDPAHAGGSGPTGLRTRAAELGGTFTIAADQPAGTVLEWTVPLPADDS
jgi:hypothetical protein